MTLTRSEAYDKWRHRFDAEKGGFVCPVTNKIVKSCYTDHSRTFEEEGNVYFVPINSCKFCGDDPEDRLLTVSQRLHRLNERRKKEAQ